MAELIGQNKLLRRLTERLEPSSKGQDDNDKEDNNKVVRVLAVQGKKVTTTTTGAKPIVKKPLIVSTKSLTERTEQTDSKQVNNDKKVTILVYKSRKFATTAVSAKPAGRKLLATLANGALGKDVRDVSIKKVWIWDIR